MIISLKKMLIILVNDLNILLNITTVNFIKFDQLGTINTVY